MLVRAFVSHYRRHPLQLLALAQMIALATMLWTGVTVLTDQARSSLFQSEEAVADRIQVVRTDGQPVSVDDFVRLRLAGICVAPWLEVQRSPPDGRVIGIDPLALGCFGDTAPGGETGSLTGQPFLDISEAARLAAEQGYESQLYLLDADGDSSLPEGYARESFSLAPPTGELAESFLLNLDALSVLVLLITGLLVRSVHRLGIAQRRDSFALLYRFGVSHNRIRQLLTLELLVLTAICVLPGLWLGVELAGILGAGFGQALDSLFDVTLYAGAGESLPWHSAAVLLGLVSAVCLVDWMVPQRWQQALARRRGQQVAGLMLLTGLVGVALAPSLAWVFMGTTLIFAGVGWLTPGLLAAVAERSAERDGGGDDPLARWRRRELAVMFRRLALPVVALQFAMATVLAVQALVTTFEATFDEWLSQRLEAPFYVQVPEEADAVLGAELLQELEGIGPWHRVTRGQASVSPEGAERAPVPVDLFAIEPLTELVTGWTLLASTKDPWQELGQGGVMINEQLSRRWELAVGNTLTVTVAGKSSRLDVVAVYADYGRPAGEILMHGAQLPQGFDARFESFSIDPGRLGMETISDSLAQSWDTAGLTVRDNASIQALATQVFDQTFLLTRAISLFTLVLAALALLIMGWVFFTTRVWYCQLLVAWGMPLKCVHRQLQRLSITLTLSITVAALPLGLWLTWVLVSRINPLAFGWSLPMDLYPVFWLELGLVAAGIGLVIALLMRRQLTGLAPLPPTSRMTGAER